ncbi:HD domain-containing protein [Chryseobacterium flavum]|nr:HD domain-containing protein [Chryseobacterium flavum]
MEVIQKIIEFADRAHGVQTRKYNTDRYIVMEICRPYTDKLPVLAAAILHDVIEDTPVTGNEILFFLSHYMNAEDQNLTIKMVLELTDVYVKKDFSALNRSQRKRLEIKRLKTISADAQTIKYADIIDNAREISQNDPLFAKRFLTECDDILLALKKGEYKLREKAVSLVREELRKLNSK